MTPRWVTWVGAKGPTLTAHALAEDGRRTLCKLVPNAATVREAGLGELPPCRRCMQRANAVPWSLMP